MTQSPKVSVVIPCHNRAHTVTRAVRSVLDQTLQEIEVIAVDDGSQDATLQVLNQINDARLTVISLPEQSGAANARNHGAGFAKAPWIAFQDSDDYWHPEKLALQLAASTQSSAVANFCRMVVFQDGCKIGQVPNQSIDLSGNLSNAILRDSFISTQTVMIRTEKFAEIGGMDPKFRSLDDWDMMIRLAQLGPIDLVDQVLVDQHMSENSMTHDRAKQLDAQIRILEKHDAVLAQFPQIKAVHLNRIAGACRKMGKYQQAASYAARAVRLRPGNARFWGQSIMCGGGLAASPVLRLARR